jgi:peptidoglycan/LPS O-acetylase OafA/YrhL
MLHNNQYLSNLTPLRGIAALLVAIFHFEMAIARFVPAHQTMFFEKSYIMVDLFFVLSGFIMMHVYGNAFISKISKTALREFMVARFARIYPLHFFSLLLLIFFVLLLPPAELQYKPVENPSAILTNFLLLHSFGIHKIFTWNIPSWSISAEWWCYLIFPLLAFFISKKKSVTVPILLLFVAIIYCCIMYIFPRTNPLNPSAPVPHNINTTYDYGFFRGLAGFTTGMIMYIIYQLPSVKKIIRKDIFAVFIMLLLIATLHFALNDMISVVLFALIVPAFAANKDLIYRICNNKALQYIGNISYSIYLMQIFLQVPFAHGMRLPGVTGNSRGKFNIDFSRGLLYCCIYIALLILISSITYYGIEKPCRKYINQKWGPDS